MDDTADRKRWAVNLAVGISVCALLAGLVALRIQQPLAERHPIAAAEVVNSDSVFAKPRQQQMVDLLRQQVILLFQEQKYVEGEQRCKTLVTLLPEDPTSYYNLACAQARQGKTDEAMKNLSAAVGFGFRNPQHLTADPDLDSLREREEWPQLLLAAEEPLAPAPQKVTVTPAEIQDGVAVVGESNTVWNPASRQLFTFFRQAENQTSSEVITTATDKAGELLRQWQKEESAAGLTGVLYDNHDSDHSTLNTKLYPQLTRIIYSAAARRHNVHHGLQTLFRFNGIVLGNSSTAMVNGPFWRSQPRLAYCDARAMGALATQYFGNHLYFYPEHRDYDPGTNGKGGYGDVYPANTPYVVISQGSSGSDRVFMDAFAATLAALQPETRRLLAQKSALIPCLQMIFRMCNAQVNTTDDYLTGVAHPPVFRGDQINKLKMVEMAHELQPTVLPPVTVMEVVDEDQFVAGRDYFDVDPRESLFTTPAAIARVCRSVQQTRRMTISAQKSLELNQLPLEWHWVVLQGDSRLIEIQPQNKERSVVTVSVKHHQRQPIRADSNTESSRVDIGVFAHNGTYYSAPAIVSFFWPANETRTYSDDGRILSVEYRTMKNGGVYTDPIIVTGRDWIDEYRYNDNNQLTGWVRTIADKRERFTRDGYLVKRLDNFDRPIEAAEVRYVASGKGGGIAPVLSEEVTGVNYTYSYASEDDDLGTAVRQSAGKSP